MGSDTSIGWTDFTLNPWTWRCAPVAPECDLCYAETLTNRWQGPGSFRDGPPALKAARLLLPFTDAGMRAHLRCFLASMTDPFHPGIPWAAQAAVWAMMAADQRHEYQVLTKRPHVARKLLTNPEFPAAVQDGIPALIARLKPKQEKGNPERRAAIAAAERAAEGFRWPLPNVLLGVSAGTQDTADKFIPELARTPAATRFLSWEPALDETDVRPYLGAGGLDWVILGGESGRVHKADPFDPPVDDDGKPTAARPMRLEWLRSMKEQADEAGVPVFVKQLGAVQAHALDLGDRKGEDWAQWPKMLKDLKVRDFPEVPTQ